MRKHQILFILIFFSTLAISQNKILVNVSKPGAVIDKNIYGQFAEHLGHCIYDGIYVGDTSKIPNIRGFRTDIIEALKEIKVPLVRWPGGCFADTYHWKDGIGPKSNRPSIINTNWGGTTEDNSFGTHEFLDFCELIGAEPYINLNMGSGTVKEAVEWIEYVTSSNESPMTKLRKQNGREKPWNVKIWAAGNENWGCGGNMRPEYYADLYRQYATYMNCPGMYKIACGANSSNFNWTEVLMREAGSKMNGISLHYYTIPGDVRPVRGSATKFNDSIWFVTMFKTLKMEELVTKHSAIMDKYDPNKKVGLLVDEWGTWFDVEPGTNPGYLFQQNTLRDALVAGINLNIFNNHADRVRMSNIAQMVNVLQSMILTKNKEMVLTPTYYVFKMYSVHQNANIIPLEVTTQKYSFGQKSIDAISASASEKDGVLSITICNLDPTKKQDISIQLNGKEYKTISGSIVTADKINAFNDFGKKPEVVLSDFKNLKLKGNQIVSNIPSKSVVLIQLKH